jgi:flagellar L-ring protein precursor FlgH
MGTRMIVKKAFVIVVAIMALGFLISPSGSELMADDSGPYASMFSDIKARRVGDVVTVEIIEVSTARSEARTKTENEHESSFANQATGDFDFLPLFNIGSSVSNEYDGEGRTTRQGSLRAKITAKIIEIDEAGNYVIEGSRTVDINGERQTTTLTGTVRPQDVTADNIIYSYNISNAEITYSGKGMVNDAHKPGIITRILNWIF